MVACRPSASRRPASRRECGRPRGRAARAAAAARPRRARARSARRYRRAMRSTTPNADIGSATASPVRCKKAIVLGRHHPARACARSPDACAPTQAIRLKTWLASIGSGAPHHFRRSSFGDKRDRAARASSAQRPSCQTIAGTSASPSLVDEHMRVDLRAKADAGDRAWRQAPSRSAPIPSSTRDIQSDGSCSTKPGAGRVVAIGARKAPARLAVRVKQARP